jgi:hypothetical protein
MDAVHPPLPTTFGPSRRRTTPASSCAQLHNSLGGGNDPQGWMEEVLLVPLLEKVPPVTPDPALYADPVLDPAVALDPDVVVDP